MRIALRVGAWLLAAVVIFITLGPPRYRPHAAMFTRDGEHALAFVLIGLAFAFAYPRQRLWVACLSVALVGLLELLQLVVPGRHAHLEDFAVDALATLAGIAIAVALGWMMRSHWHAKAQ